MALLTKGTNKDGHSTWGENDESIGQSKSVPAINIAVPQGPFNQADAVLEDGIWCQLEEKHE